MSFVESLPCEQKWHFCSHANLFVCVSEFTNTHTNTEHWHLIGKERQSIYFSLLKTHTEGWNQSSALVELVLGDVKAQLISLTHSLAKQVNSENLSLRRMAVSLRNTNKYSLRSAEPAPWLHFIGSKRRCSPHTPSSPTGGVTLTSNIVYITSWAHVTIKQCAGFLCKSSVHLHTSPLVCRENIQPQR